MKHLLSIAPAIPALKLILTGVIVLSVSGFLSFILRRKEKVAAIVGSWGSVLGCAIAFPPALLGFLGLSGGTLSFAWRLPVGSLSFALDPLSSFFLVPLLLLSALAAIYSRGYYASGSRPGALGAYWLFFNLLAASMALVLLSSNAASFLIAWELMSVSSFALVAFDHESEASRKAAWTYLFAAHVGTAFLMALFILLDSDGSLSFISMSLEPGTKLASLAFLLALAGFGLKAGFIPAHVWLPEAHPAAPSPVSALMSGVMIKLGVYGILRVLSILGAPCAWWGWLLLGLGVASACLGALFALCQSDLKRLLAYSSVENMGIASIGLGLGVVGLAAGHTGLAALGFAGAFLHMLNHSAFKGLLFLCAGSVMHGAGTLKIDSLGGLLRRMPWTGSCFIGGSAAISGLPPFNGFIGEFVIYMAAFTGVLTFDFQLLAPSTLAIGALALTGGLAAAVFAKASGIPFLGEPRKPEAAHAHESPWSMRVPMLALLAACLLLSVLAPRLCLAMAPAISSLTASIDMDASQTASELSVAFKPLLAIGCMSCAMLLVFVLVSALRNSLPMGSVEDESCTWDCGYAAPTPRIQYTGSSLVQPLRDFLKPLARPFESLRAPFGAFPSVSSYSSVARDLFEDLLWRPLVKSAEWAFGKSHALQSGHLHFYILLIMAALGILLLWTFAGGGASL